MFSKCLNEEEVKVLFRKLALKLHPDQGGCVDLMVKLQDSYEDAIQRFKNKNVVFEEFVPKYSHTHENLQPDDEPGQPFHTSSHSVGKSQINKLKILDVIYRYAKAHKKFNTNFIDSLDEFLEQNGFLTSFQYNKLVNIYYAFRMDKHET